MDITLKLKKAAAGVATLALLAGNATVALAANFMDVPSDHWGYQYLMDGFEQGIFDAAEKFNPDDTINRATLAKIAVTAVDGLAAYEAPANPTFTDVNPSDWFYPYVEAAVQLGIVNGYADMQGNLTGLFGPADAVNRAAAAKILVNTFGLATDLEPASVFPDVMMGDWFYDYVVTAYNQSVVDGYANGSFGPADALTRIQMAKLIQTAQNPMDRGGMAPVEPVEPVEPGEPEIGISDGDLEVSLSAGTAASSTIPKSASSVKLLSFDLSASKEDLVITNAVVTRGGVGNVGDWENLYLYNGAERLTTGRTLSADTNTATFPLKLTVKSGSTVTLTLVGDMSETAGAQNQHYFYLASAADLTTNGASVSGDFPVAGNTVTTGSLSVETLTVNKGTQISEPRVGGASEKVSTFKLTAGSSNDISIHAVTLTQGGSLNADEMDTFVLKRGNDVMATTAEAIGDRVIFVLDMPYTIPKGQNKSFDVFAAINSGRTSDTVQFYVEEPNDVVAIDMQYGHGALIVNDTFEATDVAAVNLQGGAVTLVDNGPSAQQIASNANNLELLNYGITGDTELTVRDTKVTVTITDANNAKPDVTVGSFTLGNVDPVAGPGDTYDLDTFANADAFLPADMFSIVCGANTYYGRVVSNDGLTTDGGLVVFSNSNLASCTSNSEVATERNPYAYLKNLLIKNMDSGSTVAGPLTLVSDGTSSGVADTVYTKNFSEDYILPGAKTQHLSVQINTALEIVSGYRVTAAVDYTVANTIKNDLENEYVAAADIVGGNLSGDAMTIAANTLVVTRSSLPTSQTYVKGEKNVPALGISLKAGDAGAVTVKQLTLRAYAETDGDYEGDLDGTLAANTLINTVSLYMGSDLIATESLDAAGSYYHAVFDNLSIEIPKGQTKDIQARVELRNTAVGFVALDLIPATDILVEDFDDNTITPTGSALNPLNGLLTDAHLVEIAVTSGGDLNIVAQSGIDSRIVVDGATDQLFAKYQFISTKEDFAVNKVTIVNTDDADFTDAAEATTAVSAVTVKYPDKDGVMQTAAGSLSNGSSTISTPGFMVKKGNQTTYLEVYANVSTLELVGESLSGKTVRLGLFAVNNTQSTFDAVGQASGDTKINPTVSQPLNVNSFVVRATKPVVTKETLASSSLSAGERELYKFKVTADNAGPVGLARIVFNVVINDAVDPVDLSLNNFKLFRGGTLLTNVSIANAAGANIEGNTAITEASADQVIVAFETEETVSSGSPQTYTLKATVASANPNDSVVTEIATGDEAAPVTTLVDINNGNVNTGKLVDDTGAAEGLFVEGGLLATLGTALNFIWTDKSDQDLHIYSLLNLTPSSTDFTNGHLLKLTELSSVSLNYNN